VRSDVGVWMTGLARNTYFQRIDWWNIVLNSFEIFGRSIGQDLKKYLVRPRYRLQSPSSLYQLHELFSNDFSIPPSFHRHLGCIVDTSTLQQKFPYKCVYTYHLYGLLKYSVLLHVTEFNSCQRRNSSYHRPFKSMTETITICAVLYSRKRADAPS
jgi:hypothetical protein